MTSIETAKKETMSSSPMGLGKLKEPPQERREKDSSPSNPLVDAAFKRLFGYSWGTSFDLSVGRSEVRGSSAEQQMVEIFGKARTARILNTPWDAVAPLSCNPTPGKESYNPAAISTTKIVRDTAVRFLRVSESTKPTSSTLQVTKKRRLEEIDYKTIALPSHIESKSLTDKTVNTAAGGDQTTIVGGKPTKNNSLDSVLNQIAGKKQLNTVEKSSNDWEGFKETDKTLQDELERQAQGKNAYLVKQDFLNRVDQRTFELEKEERDKERSRRAVESQR